MKKLFIPVITLAILLPGCWDLTESEKLGLVTLIGVDSSNNDQVKVVIHELSYQKQSSGDQKGGNSGKAPVTLHEAAAPTIFEAVQKITATDFRKIHFAHANAIILSEELVHSKGIRPFIDFFERTPEIRRNTWLLIAMEGQFDKIFSTGTIIEPDTDTGKVITEIIGNKSINSFITANTLGEFLNLFWETGSQPYTSGISLIEITTGNRNQGDGTSSNESNIYDLDIENAAVFKEDKLTGWMDNMESMGLLWVNGSMKGGIVSVRFDDKKLTLKVIRTDSDIKPVMVDGKMQINIRVNVQSDIGDSQVNLDFDKTEVIEKIQNLQNEEIKKQILAALDKSRRLDSDVFGFGNFIYDKYPKIWNQIEASGDDYYRNIDVNIDVNSSVNNIGLIKKAANIGTIYKKQKE